MDHVIKAMTHDIGGIGYINKQKDFSLHFLLLRSKIPELNNVIITFLTARSEDYSQVAGFDAGADDYITKPIKPKLLVSKVKALLRRLKEQEKNSETLNVGGIEINREEYKIIKDNIVIALPRKEFELFYLLASKPGKVFRRDEILDKVWGNEVVVGGRTIDVHIRKLREKIGEDFFVGARGGASTIHNPPTPA